MARLWRAMCAWKLRGPWRPGAHNIVLLIAQVCIIWGAAQRGMDYVQSAGRLTETEGGARAVSTLAGIETQIPLQALGYAFLIPAGLAFFGLASGWSKPLSVGHLLVGASYLVLGITYLRQAPIDSIPLAATGSALLLAAAWLLVTRFRRLPDVLAMTGGTAAMLVGGWLAAKGLGYGYRTGNGYLGSAVLHFVFGFGTQVLARRETLLRREDEDDLVALKAVL